MQARHSPHAPRTSASPALVPALSRALTLLERLAQRREPMSLARLASELELPKSSVLAAGALSIVAGLCAVATICAPRSAAGNPSEQ